MTLMHKRRKVCALQWNELRDQGQGSQQEEVDFVVKQGTRSALRRDKRIVHGTQLLRMKAIPLSLDEEPKTRRSRTPFTDFPPCEKVVERPVSIELTRGCEPRPAACAATASCERFAA